ncbi:B9 protein [Ancylostoma duodenale]|uniref:B9 domain-containing protein 2 n=1 Tax=Ancylostoma duodenale TaxID=51022 RepID=A0A0C2GDR2_9BILA|nr:B9 protein [Ancylostoma duodenale]
MAEVYISGQIESADGFGDNRVCCRWSLLTGRSIMDRSSQNNLMCSGGGWRVVEGAVEGQTQTDLPSAFEEAYFAHPIDLHLATKTIQGWPRIELQVWHHDVYGRQELVGYGSLFLPSTPGEHEVRILFA